MDNKPLEAKTERTAYFDYLRVFATFAVIVIHVSAQNWYITDVNEIYWQTYNFYESIVRWAVPVFVMISGALFLEREIPVRKLYSKYILRLITAFVFWSVIYVLFEEGPVLSKISAVVRGNYHMWFILMIIGLYICIPFFKAIVADEKRIRYFLILSLIFAFVIPQMVMISLDLGNEFIIKGIDVFKSDIDEMNVTMVMGYAGYFVLGYFLNRIELNKKTRIVIYILGLLGFAFTIVADLLVALKTQECCNHYYESFNVNVLFEALAVFTLFKYAKFENVKMNRFFRALAKYSFGAYLIHVLILNLLNNLFGINTLSFNPILSVPALSILAFVVSMGISAAINQIPILKKYIV